MIRTYSLLRTITTFHSRYLYLKIPGSVGERTFGSDRFLNQQFYKSSEWKRIREAVIVRDNGCDLAFRDFPITGKILVHHMNPMTLSHIVERDPDNLNPEFLVCTSERTHQAIHFGDSSLLPELPVLREPRDTQLW